MAENGVNGGGAEGAEFTAMKPQLLVPAPGAAEAVQFYKDAFGAEEVARSLHPKRKAEQELPLMLAAELKIGSSVFIVSDRTEESDTSNGGYVICLETGNVEAAVAKAVEAGATQIGEVAETEGYCCGARSGKVKDPYGNVWAICSATPVPAAGTEA